MDPAYYVAAGSLKARSFQLDVVSNNLANTSTPGYKPEKSFFALFNKARDEGQGLPLSGYLNDGTVLASRGTDFSQGVLKTTGRTLDLALDGTGFFMVKAQGRTLATRDGRFTLSRTGELQTLDGATVLGKNGQPIVLDTANPAFTVLPDGTVQQGPEPRGQLDIRDYQQTDALQRVGANRFDPGGATAKAAAGQVVQGSQEQSSVDMATCMIDMIRLNRLFEMSLKAASTITNDMDAKSISDVSTGR
ncbi:flagellar hook-basal body protein [Mesoterricola sediminis]|uniref:Flagellar basal-body rod protein FlgF n=1 Tax=Mesoterricola sediminis TaxID=2927980 RepID=A0AA48GTM9_9BACT|nr:flagellar hook basal-body protein [Mesoterricola sediminis]BDU77397.1 flagellar basal-body rod protein FlgF [Mesoterricola sediminis]